MMDASVGTFNNSTCFDKPYVCHRQLEIKVTAALTTIFPIAGAATTFHIQGCSGGIQHTWHRLAQHHVTMSVQDGAAQF